MAEQQQQHPDPAPPSSTSRSPSPGNSNSNGRVVSGSLRDRIARFENPSAAPLVPTHPFGASAPQSARQVPRGGMIGNRLPSLDPKSAAIYGAANLRKVSESRGLYGNRIPSAANVPRASSTSGRSASPAGSVGSSNASVPASGSPISRDSSPPTSPGGSLPPSLLAATSPDARDGALTPSSTRAEAGEEAEADDISAPSTPVASTAGDLDLVAPNLKLVGGELGGAHPLQRELSTQSDPRSVAPSLGSSRMSQYPSSQGSANPDRMMQDVSGVSTPTSTPRAEHRDLESIRGDSVRGEGSVNGDVDVDDTASHLGALGIEGVDRDPTPEPPAAEDVDSDFVKATEEDGHIVIEPAPAPEDQAVDSTEPEERRVAETDKTPKEESNKNLAFTVPTVNEPVLTKDKADDILGQDPEEDPNKAADLDDLKAGNLSGSEPSQLHTVDASPINDIAQAALHQGFDAPIASPKEQTAQGGAVVQRMDKVEDPTPVDTPSSIELPKEDGEASAQDEKRGAFGITDDIDVQTATPLKPESTSGDTDKLEEELVEEQKEVLKNDNGVAENLKAFALDENKDVENSLEGHVAPGQEAKVQNATRGMTVGLATAEKEEGSSSISLAENKEAEEAAAVDTEPIAETDTSKGPKVAGSEVESDQPKGADDQETDSPFSSSSWTRVDGAEISTLSFPTPPQVDPNVVDPRPTVIVQHDSRASTPDDPSVLKSFPQVPDEEHPYVEVHVSPSASASASVNLHSKSKAAASKFPDTPLAKLPGKSKSLSTRDLDMGEQSPATTPRKGESSATTAGDALLAGANVDVDVDGKGDDADVDATPLAKPDGRLAKTATKKKKTPKSPLLDDEDPGDFEGEGWAVVTKGRGE